MRGWWTYCCGFDFPTWHGVMEKSPGCGWAVPWRQAHPSWLREKCGTVKGFISDYGYFGVPLRNSLYSLSLGLLACGGSEDDYLLGTFLPVSNGVYLQQLYSWEAWKATQDCQTLLSYHWLQDISQMRDDFLVFHCSIKLSTIFCRQIGKLVMLLIYDTSMKTLVIFFSLSLLKWKCLTRPGNVWLPLQTSCVPELLLLWDPWAATLSGAAGIGASQNILDRQDKVSAIRSRIIKATVLASSVFL